MQNNFIMVQLNNMILCPDSSTQPRIILLTRGKGYFGRLQWRRAEIRGLLQTHATYYVDYFFYF